MNDMSTTQAQPNSKVVILDAPAFLSLTKAKSKKIADALPIVDGGTTSYRLPSSGLANMLWVNISGTVVVAGTVSSGTLKSYPNPSPLSIIKRVRFGSNTNFSMRDMSGWGWYKWIRNRYGIDGFTTGAVSFSNNNGVALGTSTTGVNRIVAGANIVAQTYTVNICLPMPIAYNNFADQGLLLLQQSSVFYDLTIDWGQITGGISATGGSNDLFTTLVGTGLSVTSTLTCTVGYDWFDYVDGVGELASMFMSASEYVKTPLNTGDNVIDVPPSDFYSMLSVEILNAGAPVAVANIQSPRFMHSGNVVDFDDSYITRLMKTRYLHRNSLPFDGCIDYDFGSRGGNLDKRDGYDLFNNLSVTQAQVIFTIPGTLAISGVNQTTLFTESLRAMRQ